MTSDKILLNEAVYEHEITEVFANFENKVLSLSSVRIKLFSFLCIMKSLELDGVFSFVGYFLYVAEQPHAECIRVKSNARH